MTISAQPGGYPRGGAQDIWVVFFQHKGRNFTALCDRYLGFLKIQKPTTTDFPAIQAYLCDRFRQFGVPEVIEMDGGPPFNGVKWQNFLARWGIRHRLNSVMYPESNS